MRSCKELREAKDVRWINKGLTATDLVHLALLGTLGSVLPALEWLILIEPAAGPEAHGARPWVRPVVPAEGYHLSSGLFPLLSTQDLHLSRNISTGK
jgi:hypothetical protein